MGWNNPPEGVETKDATDALIDKVLKDSNDDDQSKNDATDQFARIKDEDTKGQIKALLKLSEQSKSCQRVNNTTLATDVAMAWTCVMSGLVDDGMISEKAADQLREMSAELTRLISDCRNFGHFETKQKAPCQLDS